jgi:putative hydrolase of the HAD superfamily
MTQKIKAVFFDVGQTLLTPGIPEEVSFIEAATSVGAILDPAAVIQAMPQAYGLYEQLYQGDDSFWSDEERATAIWIEVYRYLAELAGIPEYASEVARLVHQTYFSAGAWQAFDDVRPTLDALKDRGLRIGLISNWDSSLEPIIMDMGFGHYFSTIIASTVVRMHKPQQQIFDLALERMDVSAAEAVHVGDHLQADVEGARNAGLTPVLIDRQHRHDQEVAGSGLAVVHDLRDLLQVLQGVTD